MCALALPAQNHISQLEKLREFLATRKPGYEFYFSLEGTRPKYKRSWKLTPLVWEGYRIWEREIKAFRKIRSSA